MKAYWGNRGTAPLTCNFGAGWRFAVNITLRSHYPRKRTPIPVEWEVGWTPRDILRVLEKRKIFHTHIVGPVAQSV